MFCLRGSYFSGPVALLSGNISSLEGINAEFLVSRKCKIQFDFNVMGINVRP